MASKMAPLSDEIQYISLYTLRPIILHFYLLPFIPLYLTWLYVWVVVYGVNEYFEAGLIVLAIIGCVQILSCLFCHWSVHVRSFFTCSSVSYLPYKIFTLSPSLVLTWIVLFAHRSFFTASCILGWFDKFVRVRSSINF